MLEFEAFRTERKTKSGQAAVDMAEKIYLAGNVTEARLWLKLALEVDNKDLSGRIDALERKFGGDEQLRGVADEMRELARASGDNVLDFPGKDSI